VRHKKRSVSAQYVKGVAMSKKVVITDYVFPDVSIEKDILTSAGLALVDQKKFEGEAGLIKLVSDADYVITQFAPVNANVVNAMKSCKIIVRYGIGYDNVDFKAAAAKGIPVCNVPDFCIDEVADHTLAMILAMTRNIVFCWDVIRRDKQWKLPVPMDQMHVLRQMTVGLVAYGKIAKEVAMRLKPFKCKVMVFDPLIDTKIIEKDGFIPASLDEIYAQADIISLHCPVTDKTRGMINSSTIAKMKKGVLFVNTGRGDLVKSDDMIAALKSGHVAAAAMDVTNPEPINMDSPFLTMDNVIINAHIASVSASAVKYLRSTAAKLVVMRAQGKKLFNIVNGVNL
jgi:D-3-phosphoglycerate dehydrogenase / 2-oxoglutarate reductase